MSAEPPRLPADPLGAPDVAVVVCTMLFFCVAHSVQRFAVSPRSATFRTLPPLLQQEWTSRAVNLGLHVAQMLFNLRVVFFCAATRASPLYGYDTASHAGFLTVLAYYLYDTVVMCAHEDAAYVLMWLVHHGFAIVMLAWLSVRRVSALPAATFLLSAAGHVGNEVRWFLRTTKNVDRRLNNFVGVMCNVFLVWTSIIPPPYLVYATARSREVTWWVMFSQHMRWQCIGSFLFVWLMHVLTLFVQVKRTIRHWDGHALRQRAHAKTQ